MSKTDMSISIEPGALDDIPLVELIRFFAQYRRAIIPTPSGPRLCRHMQPGSGYHETVATSMRTFKDADKIR